MEHEILKELIKNYPIITAILIILIPILNGVYLNKFSLVNRQMRIVRIFVETMTVKMQLSYASNLMKHTEEVKKYTSSEIATAIKFHEIMLKGIKLYSLQKLREIVEVNHIPKKGTKKFYEYCNTQFNLISQGMWAIYADDYSPKIHLVPFCQREKKWHSYQDEYAEKSRELLKNISDIKNQNKGGLNGFKRFFTNQ